MAKFVLGIDTTGSRLNLGLDNFEGVHRAVSLPLGKALSTDLHTSLQTFMADQSWSEVGAIAVIVGPGSYTGSRMGVVTARTLAQGLKIPLYGLSSLAMGAAISQPEPDTVAISIQAQRNHVYGGIYEIMQHQLEPRLVQPEINLKRDLWIEKIKAQGLKAIEFEYTDDHSIRLVERMMAIARFKREESERGNWQDVYPNYAK